MQRDVESETQRDVESETQRDNTVGNTNRFMADRFMANRPIDLWRAHTRTPT